MGLPTGSLDGFGESASTTRFLVVLLVCGVAPVRSLVSRQLGWAPFVSAPTVAMNAVVQVGGDTDVTLETLRAKTVVDGIQKSVLDHIIFKIYTSNMMYRCPVSPEPI